MGQLVISAPWESTFGNNLNKGMNKIFPFIQIIPRGGLPRGICNKSSRAEFQNSMCYTDLFFMSAGFTVGSNMTENDRGNCYADEYISNSPINARLST